ncbi:MAG: hypothetical protein SF162_10645 [bacterium]|nr:hypothetical protein [bacterium]
MMSVRRILLAAPFIAVLLILLHMLTAAGQEATPPLDPPTETASETPTLLPPTETFTPPPTTLPPPTAEPTIAVETLPAAASSLTPIPFTVTPVTTPAIGITDAAEVTELPMFDTMQNEGSASGQSLLSDTWQSVTLHFDGAPEPLHYVVEYGGPGAGHNGTQGLVAVQAAANHPCQCGVRNATVRVRVYLPAGITVGGISFYGAYTVDSPHVGIANYVREKRMGLAESGFLEVSDPGIYPTFTLAPRPASGSLNYTDAEYFIVEVQANAYSTATVYLDTITLHYTGTLPTPTATLTPTVTPTPTATATPLIYTCRIRPNAGVTIYGYVSAGEAISGLTTPLPPVSFSATDMLRVSARASLYENVIRVERESTPGTWYWIDSGVGVTVEPNANCDALPFETNGMYAVRIISDGTRAWDAPGTTQYPDFGNPLFERQSIITALNQVSTAFDALSSTVNSPQAAFNRVMLENSGTEILLIRTQSTASTVTIPNYTYLFGTLAGQTVTLTYPNAAQGNCFTQREATLTVNQMTTRLPAVIICNGHLIDQYDGTIQRLRASAYTMVHELGHLFDYRTGDGLSDPINNPLFLLRDCDRDTLMAGGFTRGRRGWGTGPQQYMNGITTAPLITDFQQNPANTALEAAADSFLNWVYRFNDSGGASAPDPCVLTPQPPYDHWSGDGYLNLEWSAAPAPAFIGNSQGAAGTPDPRLPGDSRYFDVDTRIRFLFTTYGW